MPVDIVSQTKQDESKRGISTGCFRNRNPSQIGDMKQRISGLYNELIQCKKSLPNSREDTSPNTTKRKGYQKNQDLRIDNLFNNDMKNDTDNQSKSIPQYSPL